MAARRKDGRQLPKLPLSAFTPPPSSASAQFPLSPNPDTVNPASVIDSRVTVKIPGEGLEKWKESAGELLLGRTEAVVVSLQSEDGFDVALKQLESSQPAIPILAISIPFPLSTGPPSSAPSFLNNRKYPIAFRASINKLSDTLVEGVKWALSSGHVVEVDVQGDLSKGEEGWESVEGLIAKALEGSESEGKKNAIVVSNILPPPDSFELDIVKLSAHPSYEIYSTHTASLSLFPNVFLQFLAPDWRNDHRSASVPSSEATNDQKKEWKRRVHMYLGPAIEAFGYSRIIFGSSSSSTAPSNSGEWYAIAKECVAELGIEQEGVDAIFAENAKSVYLT